MKANETARILSKGKSIEYSKWGPYVQYSNDCFKQDFVSYGNSLLACVQSHFSDEHNEPVLLYENSENPFNVTGVQNTDYWELVMTSDNGSVYIPEYNDETGILSWKLSSSIDSVKPVRIKLLGPWEHGTSEDSATLGLQNSADGNFSVSGGFESEANGNFSQSFGYKTKTTNDYEVAFGKLNKTSDDTAFSIGNGDSDTTRSNIFEITKDGKQFLKGIGGYDGTNSDTAIDVANAIDALVSNNIPITYEELRILRDTNKLKAGNSYQITDYVTTCVSDNAISAEHQFDIIVIADDVNVLNENARAIQREGDTYFANSDLNAWELKYCLDNDTSRFAWAVPTSEGGKGVIYRMIDEYNNDCPYDFKNIQFKHPNDTKKYPDYYYTFSVVSGSTITDHSLSGAYCNRNEIGVYVTNKKQYLNRIVFINTSKTSACYRNSFSNDCYFNSFGGGCYSNSFDNYCHANSFGRGCYYNSFGTCCYSNSFDNYCYSNSFGNRCYSNSFGDYCYSNSFSGYCHANSFSGYCHSNSFGNSCRNNSFDNYCYSNSFGNECYSNSFGNYCRYNKADDGVSVILNNSKTASSNQQIQNYHFTRGLSSQTVEVERNRAYETTVAIDSSGNVKQFCIADIIQ